MAWSLSAYFYDRVLQASNIAVGEDDVDPAIDRLCGGRHGEHAIPGGQLEGTSLG